MRRVVPHGALGRFAVYNALDPKIFSSSLTLEFSMPADRKKIEVVAGGKPLAEKTQGLTDRWNAEYYRREGAAVFVTVRSNTVLEFR